MTANSACSGVMNGVTIRRLEESDLPIASRLAREFLRQAAVPAAHLNQLLADQRNIVIVALAGERAIGFLVAHQFPSLSGERLVYLYDIEVRDAYRRSGVARGMVSKLKDVCRGQSISRIWVGSSRDNPAACSLWEVTGAKRQTDQYVEFIYVLDAQPPVRTDAPRAARR